MSDPLALITLGAAVGGAAGKFVEKAWDSGEKWITSYFRDHHEDAVAAAKNNSFDFLNHLAARISKLEASGAMLPQNIDSAQKDPAFAALLQKALVGAARTSSTEKHQLLSRLVVERLQSPSETTLSLATSLAADAVAALTRVQLHLLAVATIVRHLEHTPPTDLRWIDDLLLPFYPLEYRPVDVAHLEALSCVRLNFLANQLKDVLAAKLVGRDPATASALVATYLETTNGVRLSAVWNKKPPSLNNIQLTSVGQILGVCVSDLSSDTITSFEGWA